MSVSLSRRASPCFVCMLLMCKTWTKHQHAPIAQQDACCKIMHTYSGLTRCLLSTHVVPSCGASPRADGFCWAACAVLYCSIRGLLSCHSALKSLPCVLVISQHLISACVLPELSLGLMCSRGCRDLAAELGVTCVQAYKMDATTALLPGSTTLSGILRACITSLLHSIC